MGQLVQTITVWMAFGIALSALLPVFLGNVLAAPGAAHGAGHLGPIAATWAASLLAFGVAAGAASHKLRDTKLHRKLVTWLTKGLNLALLLVIVVCAARVVFDLVPGFGDLAIVGFLDRAFAPAWNASRDLLGHMGVSRSVQGVLTAPILLGGLLIFARQAVNWGAARLLPSVEDRGVDVPRRSGRPGKHRDEEAERRAHSASRKVAVASYAEAKALLSTTQMELTFLAMDVVGSTRIKQGEDPYIIEQAFADYRKQVERMLRRHGAYKQTWTPDGQMAAFRSAQSAVDCGRDVLLALPDFNRNVSKMRSPFKLRVGANSGVVSCDDDIPMEEMSDFTIDVAGHMQKHADEDAMWIAREVYEQLADKTGFATNGEEVDGRKVYVWKRPT